MGEATIPAWRDGVLQPVDKLAVHFQGLRHPAVSVFVLCAGRLLIQQRAFGKYHTPGLWANTCCTHPYWGEPAASCAARRLQEELGLSGLDLRPVGEIEYRADVGGGMIEHELVAVFRAEVSAPPAVTENPAEVAATRWTSLPDLEAEIAAEPDRFTPWLRIYLQKHRGQIFGPPDR